MVRVLDRAVTVIGLYFPQSFSINSFLDHRMVYNIVQCWGSLIPLWRQMYNVCSTWPLYFTCTLLVTSEHQYVCNLLGDWRHRSICYTCLFTTPLVITISLLQCVMTLWRCVSERFFDLFCYLFGDLLRWSLFRVFISVSLLSLSCFLCVSLYLSLLCVKSSVCGWKRRHLPPRLHFPLLRFPNNLAA
jgi:hypothetical protein